MKNVLKPLFIAIAFAVPMLESHIFNAITTLYKGIANAQIFSIFDASNLGVDFNAYSIFLSLSVVAITTYAFAVRCVFGIQTNIKKIFFTVGLLFYLLPFQVAILSICVAFLEHNGAIQWTNLRLVAASVYLGALAMSLWTYRIIVSRKNSGFKCAMLMITNILLPLSAFAPYVLEKYSNITTCASFFVMIVWLAISADIIFEGFGYRIAQKILCQKASERDSQ